MNLEKIKELQQKQIEIMDVIHDICEKHKINYYIIGGTALGAVRHGGFIPWDIDIDIAMFRKDYEMFKEVCKTSLSEKYKYVDWNVDENYYPPHALVVMKNTKLVQKNDFLNPKLKRYGIFLDIFPLDQAPNDFILQQKQKQLLIKYRTQKERKMGITYEENKCIVRAIKKIVSILYSPIKMSKINERQEKAMKQYNDSESQFWCSMASHYSYEKQCMPKEYYGKPTLIEFEGREYYAPEQIIEYLERIFGDYMKIPSKESQQKQMDYFIDAEW